MSQLVVHPGMASPFGAAARHLHQQVDALVVSSIA